MTSLVPNLNIVRLPENAAGRDIVVGDLHGCRDVLFRLLDRAQFDPSVDRVIATGDLIDRGPDSPGCLELLKESWFHSVMGNHEQSLIDDLRFVQDCSCDRDAILTLLESHLNTMSSGWLASPLAGRDDWRAWVDETAFMLRSLPHILVVGDAGTGRRFNVVHADLWMANLMSDDSIDRAKTMQQFEFDSLLWSRALCDEMQLGVGGGSAPGLSLTFCGHSVVPVVACWQQHMFLDTGCGYTGSNFGLSAVVFQTGAHLFESSVQRRPVVAA